MAGTALAGFWLPAILTENGVHGLPTIRTGTRSVVVFTGTNFGIKEKKAATTNKALVDAATCHMLGKPQSSDSPTG
ncbi:hypothetical protein [Streptomyces tendae]|uniref:hypothetical protein n=1 Tax=Streptomyces tendae TaxID=1932 RepID=UPI003F4D722F